MRRHVDIRKPGRAVDRDQDAEVGARKRGNELRGEKRHDDVVAHRLHRFAHAGNQIPVTLDRAGGVAVDRARNQEQQEDQGHDGTHQRCAERCDALVERKRRVGIAQRRIGQQHRDEQQGECEQDAERSPLEAPPLVFAQRFQTGHVRHVAVDGRFADQARLHHLVGQPPAYGDDQQTGGSHEKPVDQRIDRHRRVEHACGLLGNAGQHRVDRRRNEVGRKTAGYAGESRCNTGQRMAPGGVEDHRAQRNHDHIAGIGGRMRDDCDQDDHRREQARRSHAQHLAQRGVDEAGVLGDPHPQHRHQHDAQRRETREHAYHLAEKARHLVTGKLVDHLNRLACLRMQRAELDRREHCRERPHDQHEQKEQYCGIREPVSDPLDDIERAIKPAAFGRGRWVWLLTHCANLPWLLRFVSPRPPSRAKASGPAHPAVAA